MSIIIHNITRDHVPNGLNQYELLINKKLICEFEHDRSHDGLAQCLRDAADAVDSIEDVAPRLNEPMSEEQITALLTFMRELKARR